jgi:hypothetical protein
MGLCHGSQSKVVAGLINHVYSFIFLWLVGLLDLPFAPKSFLEALAQKSEQLFRRPKLQPLAGIHLFHRPFEPAPGWVRLGSEPYYKGSTHVGQTRVFQKSRCEVSVRFLLIFCAASSNSG